MDEKGTKSRTEKPASFSTGSRRVPSIPGWRSSAAKPPRKKFRTGLLLAACLALGLVGGWAGSEIQDRTAPDSLSTAAKQQYISNESELIADIAKEVGQSVVSVDVQSEVPAQGFFGFGSESQASAGTGFIVSSDGIIVTNRHVIPDGATSISVTLADGTTYDNVQLIGSTSNSSSLDVAFLKIKDLKGKKVVPVTLADSAKVEVGDKVIAIGNALGQFQNTVTAGIISGYGRDVTAGDASGTSAEALSDLFQTDAAINQGNSGGPLVNINGQVIGVNTAVAGGENIGFAIPINDLKGLISGVLENGKLEQPYLGVRYVSLTDDVAYELNLETKRGAYLAPGQGETVLPNSPASKANLREKDIITKVNGIIIDDKTSLTSALARFQVGDAVTLTVIRDGKVITIKATLEATPQ